MRGQIKQLTRREYLRIIAMSAAATLIAACQPTSQPSAGASNSDPLKDIASKGAPAAGLKEKLLDGIPITSNEDFYTVWYSQGAPPKIPANWKLMITGEVEKQIALSIDDLRALPAVEEMRTFECISNPVGGELISNAIWKGVRLKDLLMQAGVKSNAKEMKLESFDGWSTSVPIETGMHEHALLAYDMNGVPLPSEHGAPLRCLWPGRYGMKQPKWIQTITIIPNEYRGYWERQGWSNDAFVNPNSRIDAPQDGQAITTPTFTMSGVANSGEAGIAKIEISWDESNDWQAAELTRGPSPYVWTIWKWTGPSLSAGKHQLFARVTDNKGRMQPRPQKISLFGETFPNGTDQMHSITVDFKG